MTGRWKFDVRTGAVAAAMLAVFSASCADLHGDLCERAATCGGGGELEVEACVADLDRREELATIYGCDDRWDDYLACLDERGYCDDDGELSGCDEVDDSYKHCIDSYERGKAKVDAENPAGDLPVWSAELEADKPKPKKCSVAGAPGMDRPSTPLAWLLSGVLGLTLLRRRRSR